jgi:hypothetical protein
LKHPERLALAFLKFFGTPMCIAAIVGALAAFSSARACRWENAAIAALIAIACGTAGFGLIWWVRFAAHPPDEDEQRRAAHPNEPWLWREDWAATAIRTSNRRDARRFMLFAVTWCIATFPLFAIVPHQAMRRSGYYAMPALIFPLAGIVMLTWAIRSYLRARQYGEATFTMASIPGQIGGSLFGKIDSELPLAGGLATMLELACIARTTRGAFHSLTIWDRVLWRAEQSTITDSAGAISVAFIIPPDCRASDDLNPRRRIVWRLSARASGPAGGFRAEFEVPVFRIGENYDSASAGENPI